MGWNQLEPGATCALRGHPTGRTSTSCTPTTRSPPTRRVSSPTPTYGARLRGAVRAGQRVRAPVPPREEPALGSGCSRTSPRDRARAASGWHARHDFRSLSPRSICAAGAACGCSRAASRETVYGDDPVAMARRWEAEGAARLHVVDLDGARAGRPAPGRAHRACSPRCASRCRWAAACATRRRRGVLAAGARVPSSAPAALDPRSWARSAARSRPGHRRQSTPATAAWRSTAGRESSTSTPSTLARDAARGRGRASSTPTSRRDGTAAGPDSRAPPRSREAVGIAVIASGGVGSLDDVRALARSPGLAGVIVGRALYSGAVACGAALAAAREALMLASGSSPAST